MHWTRLEEHDVTRREMGLALLAVALAFLFRWALDPLLQDRAPFLLFTFAVLAASVMGGARVGLFGTALSTLAALWAFVPSTGLLIPTSLERWIETASFIAVAMALSLLAGRLRDARVQAEAGERQLESAFKHQQTVVRELHHRVKNNLQTMTSLLGLRARSRGGDVAAELRDLAGRMRALGLVQARIYDTDNLNDVDFAAALDDMASELVRVHGHGQVSLRRDFDGPLTLDVARAMPLGLLCYEVILNALQHAWPQGQAGELTIVLGTRGPSAEIRIIDDGRGFRQDSVAKGLGLQLARALAGEAQVDVDTRTSIGQGTTVVLRLT